MIYLKWTVKPQTLSFELQTVIDLMNEINFNQFHRHSIETILFSNGLCSFWLASFSPRKNEGSSVMVIWFYTKNGKNRLWLAFKPFLRTSLWAGHCAAPDQFASFDLFHFFLLILVRAKCALALLFVLTTVWFQHFHLYGECSNLLTCLFVCCSHWNFSLFDSFSRQFQSSFRPQTSRQSLIVCN